MPSEKIPVFVPMNKNTDAVSNSTSSVDIWDGYLDENGYLNRRPGFASLVNLGTASKVDGAFWWDEKGVWIVTSNQNVYSLTTAGVATLIGSGLLFGIRPSFAKTQQAGVDYLAMANGNGVFYTTGAALTAIATAPTNASHVAFLDKFLIANDDGSGYFYFSNVGDLATWAALDFAEAEARPDDINALHVIWNELYLFGKDSIEVWRDDGTTPFVRLDGAESQVGCIAPRSIQYADGTFFFLNEDRNIVRLVGRTPQVISDQIGKTIHGLTTVTDALADIISIGGREFYVISFPVEDKTFAYDIRRGAWYEWSYWDATVSERNAFRGLCHAFNPSGGTHIIGDSRPTGTVYTLSATTYQDTGYDIRTAIRTGFIDHGTLKRKCGRRLQLRLKRGTLAAAGTADLTVCWRDDNESAFGNEVSLGIGEPTDSNFVAELWRTGMYRARQYEFTLTGNVPCVGGEVEETYDLMLT